MNSFGFHNNVNLEKANAILRYNRRKKIITLFRFLELFIFLLIITSRFSSLFPLISFKLSFEYFKGLFITLVSPRFVFIVGNAIIVILFLKSGKFSSNYKLESDEQINVFVGNDTGFYSEEREIRRCKSLEDFEKGKREVGCYNKELRRSVTERGMKSVKKCVEKVVVSSYGEDEMSSEEFRRKVEDFIAKQQRLLREEEFLTEPTTLLSV